MKKVICALTLVSIYTTLLCQAPHAFSYQAILRNDDGSEKANETIALQISIIRGDINGTTEYLEIHNTTTNEFGLVQVMIGNGITSDDLSTIDWSAGPYFLDIKVNGISLGTSPC